MNEKNLPTEDEWRQKLTPEEYEVLRNKGTEPPFSGKYNKEQRKGTYKCSGCGTKLFASTDKYDSGSGWPSFTKPIGEGSVETQDDNSLGMKRTEVLCQNCGGHLGHVFDDGPTESFGQRFCINSVALSLESEE